MKVDWLLAPELTPEATIPVQPHSCRQVGPVVHMETCGQGQWGGEPGSRDEAGRNLLVRLSRHTNRWVKAEGQEGVATGYGTNPQNVSEPGGGHVNEGSEGRPETSPTCTKCEVESRISGQRWGRKCLTEYARGWRKRRKADSTDSAVTRAEPRRQGRSSDHLDPFYPPEPIAEGVTRSTMPAGHSMWRRAIQEPTVSHASDDAVLICGQGVPPTFPPGCGLPYRPKVSWRTYYCCNGCGARRPEHSEGCPAVAAGERQG